MEILIIIALIFFNGLLSLTETSLTASRKLKMDALIKESDKEQKKNRYALAKKLMNNPLSSLSAIQVGITLIGILTGVYSGDTIAKSIENALAKYPGWAPYAGATAKAIIVLVITYVTIVVGELIPKRIAMTYPEKILKAMSKPLNVLGKICSPFSWILGKSVNLALKIFGFKENREISVTEEEILAAIEKGTNEGEIKEVEQDIVERVFDLGDRDVESMMTFRNELVFIDVNYSREKILNILKEDTHDFYPVMSENIDNLKGVITLQNLLVFIHQDKQDIYPYIQKAQYFPESSTAYNVLEKFKESKMYCGFVIDEFGLLQGMVTAIDFTEALIGKIGEAKEDEETIIQGNNNTWIVDGQYPFYDFLSHFEMEDIFPKNDYNTLSGLLLEITQHIPSIGEKINWNDFEFEISQMDGARIDKVVVKRVPVENKNEDESEK